VITKEDSDLGQEPGDSKSNNSSPKKQPFSRIMSGNSAGNVDVSAIIETLAKFIFTDSL
jgi:hypothetical protein